MASKISKINSLSLISSHIFSFSVSGFGKMQVAPPAAAAPKIAHTTTPNQRLNTTPATHNYQRTVTEDTYGNTLLEEPNPQGLPSQGSGGGGTTRLKRLPKKKGVSKSQRAWKNARLRQKYNVPYAISGANVSVPSTPHPLLRQVMPKASLRRNGRIDGYVPDVRRPGQGQW